jgi:hypothetical protein
VVSAADAVGAVGQLGICPFEGFQADSSGRKEAEGNESTAPGPKEVSYCHFWEALSSLLRMAVGQKAVMLS